MLLSLLLCSFLSGTQREGQAFRGSNGHTVNFPVEHQAVIPPPGGVGGDAKGWLDANYRGVAEATEPEHRVFCNRTLNLAQIEAIGFDMDYTLAQYKPEEFERLAYSLTTRQLVTTFGYPDVLLHLSFDWQYMMRGITIDKARGNLLKVDRHHYVKLAYHGFVKLSKDERRATYASGMKRMDLTRSPDFTTVDTLFSLAEAYLFMQIVELKDSREHSTLNDKGYHELYRDIRGAVDLCHRDGSLKAAVAADPDRYIHKVIVMAQHEHAGMQVIADRRLRHVHHLQDEKLLDLISMYKEVGRKVFLATNSLWDYTNVVMSFLLENKVGHEKDGGWLEHFDVVFTGCRKPGFFSEGTQLFAVNTADSTLQNTDNGAPILPIDQADKPAASSFATPSVPHNVKVFQGGSVSDLHGYLAISSASSVLYVGDHIYGDVLKSKQTLGWRTALIVPELQMELRHEARCSSTQRELLALRQLRDAQDERIQRLTWELVHMAEDGDAEDTEELRASLARAEQEYGSLTERHKLLLEQHHLFFHPIWGQMLKTGYQNSMYAGLLERFACIYTSHVSNLVYYSPYVRFRGRVDVMDHEQAVEDFGTLQHCDDAEVVTPARGAAHMHVTRKPSQTA